jgi:hypothetical protein
MVKLELVLHPDEAALVRAALEKAREDLRRATAGSDREDGTCASTAPKDVSAEAPAAAVTATQSAGSRPPGGREVHPPSLADGAILMAQTFLTATSDAGGASGGESHQIFVHLDQDVLGGDGAWSATLDDGTRLPAETLRRLACDTGLVTTRTDASGTVLDVGRRTRAIPPAIRRALWVRDRGCRWPGCPNTRFLHGHHIRHWLHGGPTSLENLVLLCSRHHRLVHEEGATIQTDMAAGTLTFRTGRGVPLPAVPTAVAIENATTALQAWASERGLEIGPDTALPWWDGSVPDYDWTISSLLADGVS